MILLALCVFAFSSWAVFSHRFDDGIVVKNLLSLAAIIAVLVVLDHENIIAAFASTTLLVLGLLVWFFTHVKPISLIHAHRPPKIR